MNRPAAGFATRRPEEPCVNSTSTVLWEPGRATAPATRQQPRRVGLGADHRADHSDDRWLARAALGGDQQARGQLVRGGGSPRLPGLDERAGARPRPHHAQARGRRRRHRPQDELGDNAELAASGAAQRPEEVVVTLLVAGHDAPVGEHDLRADELVRREPVPTAEDPEPAAEREPGDAHRRPAAGGDREAALVERVVDVDEQRAGADGREPVGDRDRAHRGDVDDDPRRRGAPGEAVAAAAHRRRQARGARKGDRGDDVRGVAQRTTALGITSSKRAIAGLRTDA